jgi:sulfate permease, SulP family
VSYSDRIGDLRARLTAARHLDPFPLRKALRGYGAQAARGDLRAGLNVALLAFPQGMAYAAIAGLPIAYGIFGSIIAAIVTPLWGGSRYIVAGPTNATAVMVMAGLLSLGLATEAERVAILPLLGILSGIFLILGALLKVASLVQYVSRSVVSGYITAAAFYIILNQLRKVGGFEVARPENATVFDDLVATVMFLPDTHLPTLFLALLTAGVFFLLDRHFRRLPNVAITLAVMSGLGVLLNLLCAAQGWGSIATLEAVSATEWELTPPPLSRELVERVAIVALVIAFLSTLEGSSIGKTLAAKAGARIDVNQEMLGLGIANVACALGQGMPASGSLTRSQLNDNSGAFTAFSSIFCGLFLVGGAFALGPLTQFIPESVLGVLVIFIGLSLINRHVLRIVWNATRSDRTVFLTTFLAALLFRLDFAIILGVAVSILLFLRKAAQPELTEYSADGQLKPEDGDSDEAEISIVHVEGDLFFGAAEIFRDQMRRACAKPNLKIVILKMRNAHHLDATSILALEDLARSLGQIERLFLISEIRPETMSIFERSGLLKVVGPENIFPDEPTNPTLSTAKAIRRAMKHLEGRSAEVKIFLGSSQKAPIGASWTEDDAPPRPSTPR